MYGLGSACLLAIAEGALIEITPTGTTMDTSVSHQSFRTWQRVVSPWIVALMAAAAAVGSARAGELKVMSFNILVGGGRAEADAIAASGADLVGIQEGNSDTLAIAALLGYDARVLSRSQRGQSNGIISRFPITQAYNNGVQVDMGELGPGYIFSVHLTSCPYQPYQLHPDAARLGCGSPIETGSTAGDIEEAIAQANLYRRRQLGVVLSEIADNVPAGAPVFLVGDFNEPSHQDWTSEAGPDGAGLHTHVVPWPASISVTSAGFVDSYRQLRPDETVDLGYTWTTYNNQPEVHDRIDFVYYQGDGLTPTASILVGDRGVAGGTASDLVVPRYPSDHRAVLTTFTLVPEPTGLSLAGLAAAWIVRITRTRRLSSIP